jgi:hypothetical protein
MKSEFLSPHLLHTLTYKEGALWLGEELHGFLSLGSPVWEYKLRQLPKLWIKFERDRDKIN